MVEQYITLMMQKLIIIKYIIFFIFNLLTGAVYIFNFSLTGFKLENLTFM